MTALEPTLLYYLRRMLSAEADAWDALQETWIKAYQKLSQLKETRQFRIWLFQIAHHTAMSHLRGRYRLSRLVERAQQAAPDEVWEDELPGSENAERVHAALDRLELPFREVLTLFFLEELSIDETAQIIGVPPGTVKSRLFHAKAQLKKVMQRGEFQ